MEQRFRMQDLPSLEQGIQDLGAIGRTLVAPWPYVGVLILVFVGGVILTESLWDSYEVIAKQLGDSAAFALMNFGWTVICPPETRPV